MADGGAFDGLEDAELWAAIDSAAASRRNSTALVIRKQVPVATSPHRTIQQNGPLVELPPSPVVPHSSPYQCLEMNNHQRGQKRYFDDENDPHFRQHKQNNRLVNSNSRPALQELPNRQLTVVSRELVQRPAEAENWSPHQQQLYHQHQQQQLQAAATPWTCVVPSTSAFKQLQDAAMGVLEKGDYMLMHGKPYIKKSGWRKIAFFFNLSFEIRDKKIEVDQSENVLRAEFLVRATMQSGRFSDGWGSCDLREKRFSKPNHDIPCTAETRAKTRACQDLVGIGEFKGASDTW